MRQKFGICAGMSLKFLPCLCFVIDARSYVVMQVCKAARSILNDEYVVASDIADSITYALSRILFLCEQNPLNPAIISRISSLHAHIVSFYMFLECILFCIFAQDLSNTLYSITRKYILCQFLIIKLKWFNFKQKS